MRVLLLSTYELGRQPVHLASPLAALERAGHETRAVDLAVDELDPGLVDWAEAVAISVPMHTAMRLAFSVAREIRSHRPKLPIALYGLYADVGRERTLGVVDALFEGEYEPGLVGWLEELATDGSAAKVSIRHTGRSSFDVPLRSGLAGLDRYARLEHGGGSYLAGAVEASHGCRHRCRHCPIPPVYDGRIRIVKPDVVLADIDQLVAAGARHITFGDPDFLNAPAHSLRIMEAAHAAHPEVTFDVTTKVEHIIDHRHLWERFASLNLLFVISAFESVHDPTLEILDKGHTTDDMAEAVEIIRGAGIHIRPTWLPFLPWTEPGHIVSLFRFLDAHDLAMATDPVQLAIKLLIPRGSLLEDHPAVLPHLTEYDPAALTWLWRFEHDETKSLYKELDAIAADASDCGRHFAETLAEMREAVSRLTGVELGPMPAAGESAPRLTESWFCCAEPTQGQAVSIQLGAR